MKMFHKNLIYSATKSILIATILCLLFAVPVVSATEGGDVPLSIVSFPDFVEVGNTVDIEGTATDATSVQYYLFGPTSSENEYPFFTTGITNAPSFKIEIPIKETYKPGEYFVVVQHPMKDRIFNLYPEGTEIHCNPKTEIQYDSYVFDVSMRITAENAVQTLCDAIDTCETADDIYVKFSFTVSGESDEIPNPENPSTEIQFNIISSPTVVEPGKTMTVTGTAENAKEVQYYIFGQNYFENGIVDTVMNSFEITVTMPESSVPGKYYLTVQHPMDDGEFNVSPKGDAIYLNEYLIFEVFQMTPERAVKALIDACTSTVFDDICCKEISFTIVDKEQPSEETAYTNIIITPSGSLEAKQSVTGTFTIDVPADSVTSEDKFTFSSPLENAKWQFSVYDSANNLIVEEKQWYASSPDTPYQKPGFFAAYADKDIKIKVSFKGIVPKSLEGSSINVISVDCTASDIGSYLSPSQNVLEKSLTSGYTDVVITPSNILEAGQTVTGTINIRIPTGSVTNGDRFTISTPLESAQFNIKIYNSSNFLMVELSPVLYDKLLEKPYKFPGFNVEYDEDVILNLCFSGKVPTSAQGSSINVISVDCTASEINSYLSPSQTVRAPPTSEIEPPQIDEDDDWYDNEDEPETSDTPVETPTITPSVEPTTTPSDTPTETGVVETKEISVEKTETLETGESIAVVELENTTVIQSVAVPSVVAVENPGASVQVIERNTEQVSLPDTINADDVHIIVSVSIVDTEGETVTVEESGYFILDATVPDGKKLVVGHYKNGVWEDCMVEELEDGHYKVYYNGLSPFAALFIEEHEESPFITEEPTIPTPTPSSSPAPLAGVILALAVSAAVGRKSH